MSAYAALAGIPIVGPALGAAAAAAALAFGAEQAAAVGGVQFFADGGIVTGETLLQGRSMTAVTGEAGREAGTGQIRQAAFVHRPREDAERR